MGPNAPDRVQNEARSRGPNVACSVRLGEEGLSGSSDS